MVENIASIDPAAGPTPTFTGSAPRLLPPQPENTPQQVEHLTHTVVATDTVFKLASTYNTSARRIMQDNGMQAPTDIKVGQTLTIARNSNPAGSVWSDVKAALTSPAPQTVQADPVLANIEPAAGRAPAPLAKPAAAQPGVQYVMHTVQPKETIYRISLQYNASVLDIMAANEFSEPQDLKADSIIRVPMKTDLSTRLAAAAAPEGLKQQAVQTGMVEPEDVKSAELETKAVKEQAQTEATMATANVKPVTIDMAKLAEQKRGKVDEQAARAKGLVWPVKGEIVRKFGDDGNGVALTGINIAVPEGTPVLAAEGGKVLYADNGLKVYGNLVLVQHPNGMVSAYAHNSYLLVKKGEKVRKGQVLALSGASGNVEKPQLHFELRQHASAVDPLNVLPKL